MADVPRKLADSIEIARKGSRFSLRIDGEEFPYWVADPIAVTVGNDNAPGITVTILADSVTVTHALQDDGQ